jgi:hypothetical protein
MLFAGHGPPNQSIDQCLLPQNAQKCKTQPRFNRARPPSAFAPPLYTASQPHAQQPCPADTHPRPGPTTLCACGCPPPAGAPCLPFCGGGRPRGGTCRRRVSGGAVRVSGAAEGVEGLRGRYHSARALSSSSCPWNCSMQPFMESFCVRQAHTMLNVRPWVQIAKAGYTELLACSFCVPSHVYPPLPTLPYSSSSSAPRSALPLEYTRRTSLHHRR